ncbi:MAG: serine/threonine-protein kinase [Phycisphaerae bacterium]|nr:serine/threonine-protein kinase [Phycisphaerae bacterium]
MQRRLGSGANSVIFEVLDTQTGQSYALKRIVRRSLSDQKFFLQAENEFQIARQIDHPVIRKMYDLVRVRSFFRVREMRLLMEMFYGQTIETHQPTDILDIVAVFRQAAAGLEAMHAAGFAHADIKPNNILVGPDGAVKIIDLGQSCPLGTIKQRIQGTPDYIAPEQVHRRPIDQRTDIYNLGATLYWVLTGQHLPTVLPRAQPGREIALVTSSLTVPPHELNPRVPPALSRLVMDSVNLAPADRPADMKILGNRLEMIEIILTKEAAQSSPSAGRGPEIIHDWDDGDATSDDDTVDMSELGLE